MPSNYHLNHEWWKNTNYCGPSCLDDSKISYFRIISLIHVAYLYAKIGYDGEQWFPNLNLKITVLSDPCTIKLTLRKKIHIVAEPTALDDSPKVSSFI